MIPERSSYIKQKKAEGWKICGVTPGFYPKEILLGANLLPVEIWDPAVEISLAYPHLQPTICSIAKIIISFLKTDAANLIDVIFVNHICDSLQNLGSLIHDFGLSNKPILFFYNPKEPYSSSTNLYLKDILKSLISGLNQLNMPVSLEKVQEHISHTARNYRLISKLFEMQSLAQTFLGPMEFGKIIRSFGYLMPLDFNTSIDWVINDCPKDFNIRYRLVLSGIFPYQHSIMEYLSSRHVTISQDDSLFLRRRIPKTFSDEPEDPIQELINRYLSLPPCPTRGSDLEHRAEHIIKLVGESNSQGVLFICTKFCEPEYFDLPYLKDSLDSHKIPHLVLETEIGEPLSMANFTRLDAFLEGLR